MLDPNDMPMLNPPYAGYFGANLHFDSDSFCSHFGFYSWLGYAVSLR
jgi:hypothetical protein